MLTVTAHGLQHAAYLYIATCMHRAKPAQLLQDGVCQACQKGQTAGHAVKALVLKGKPYKPLWKYGYRSAIRIMLFISAICA